LARTAGGCVGGAGGGGAGRHRCEHDEAELARREALLEPPAVDLRRGIEVPLPTPRVRASVGTTLLRAAPRIARRRIGAAGSNDSNGPHRTQLHRTEEAGSARKGPLRGRRGDTGPDRVEEAEGVEPRARLELLHLLAVQRVAVHVVQPLRVDAARAEQRAEPVEKHVAQVPALVVCPARRPPTRRCDEEHARRAEVCDAHLAEQPPRERSGREVPCGPHLRRGATQRDAFW